MKTNKTVQGQDQVKNKFYCLCAWAYAPYSNVLSAWATVAGRLLGSIFNLPRKNGEFS